MKRDGGWSGVSWGKITQSRVNAGLRMVMLALEKTLNFEILDDLAGIRFGSCAKAL
jgi:hypothetical protein